MQPTDYRHDVNLDTTWISYGDEDGRVLEVKVTSEGVIMDAFEDFGDTLVGTVGRMADEWWHYIEGGSR